MAISRKDALERLTKLTPRVEEHLAKIAAEPDHPAVSHWVHEVNNWLGQMEQVIRHVGQKTGAEWSERIRIWRDHIGV